MSEEFRKEDEFTEKIDTLLSGKETKAEAVAGEEYSSELDFAAKIKGNREEPSEVFKNKLMSELLQRLTTKGTRPSFWEQVWHIISSTALHQAAVPVAVFILVIVTMWGLGVFSHQLPGKATTPILGTKTGILGTIPVTTEKLEISANASRTSYPLGQLITLEITLRNNTSDTVNIGLFPPETSLVKQDNPAEIVRSFKADKAILKIQPGEAGSYILTWDQKDDNGMQVSPGKYDIRINLSVHAENIVVDISGLPVIIVESTNP